MTQLNSYTKQNSTSYFLQQNQINKKYIFYLELSFLGQWTNDCVLVLFYVELVNEM